MNKIMQNLIIRSIFIFFVLVYLSSIAFCKQVNDINAIIQKLKDPDIAVQYEAAQALAKVKDIKAVDTLISLLKHEEWFVREAVAKALGEIKDTRAVEPLINLLKDDNAHVQQAAAEALGKIPDSRAITALKDWQPKVKSESDLPMIQNSQSNSMTNMITEMRSEARIGYKDSNIEPDGFREIKWGTDLSTLKGMKYLTTDPSYGGVQLYNKINDELRIGGAELDGIVYGFWRGKFCSVDILTKGSVNFQDLHTSLWKKFGIGVQSNKYIEKYNWFGKKTWISLEYNEITQEGLCVFWSEKISEQQRSFSEKQAIEGANKGF